MTRLAVKNGYQKKDIGYNEIGLCVHSMDINNLGLQTILRRAYMIA